MSLRQPSFRLQVNENKTDRVKTGVHEHGNPKASESLKRQKPSQLFLPLVLPVQLVESLRCYTSQLE